MPDNTRVGVGAQHAAIPSKGAMGGLLALFDWAGRILLSALVGRDLGSRPSHFARFTRVVLGGALCGLAFATVTWGVLSALDRIRYDTPPLLLWGGGIGGGVLGIILWILADSLNNPDRLGGMPILIDDDHQLLGRALADARRRARLSQEEVTSRAKVSETYVSLLERGFKSPSVGLLFVLAGIYGVPASEILRQVENRTDREGDSIPAGDAE